jgi:hypothetical protein
VTHNPTRSHVVELVGGPLAGRFIAVDAAVLDRPEFHHGIHQPSRGTNGMLWSYAHRWPTACPRYVITAETNTAQWRTVTDAEYEAGEAAEADHMHWLRVLNPLPYAADEAFYARCKARQAGVTDPAALDTVGDTAVYLARRRDGAGRITRRGHSIPDVVEFVADVRGNLQVRLDPARNAWFQPGQDALTVYPADHVWVPPVRYTSELLRKGPLAEVPHGLITDDDRQRLDLLRKIAAGAAGHRA